jgi:hypothetical protein
LKGDIGAAVANPSPGRVEVDAGHEGGEFGGRHLDTVGPGDREAEGPTFEPLDVGIAIPSFLVRYTIFARSGCRRYGSSASIAIDRGGSWE